MSVVTSVFSAASAASFWSSCSSGRGASARSKTPLPRPNFLRRGVGKTPALPNVLSRDPPEDGHAQGRRVDGGRSRE
eukprot:5263067-Alexandrium_andersonii.AAC.1